MVSVLDTFGNQIKSYDYDAFGKQKNSPDDIYRPGLDDNPFRYCGEYFDTETNLIYLRARYYNPDIQRFVAEDPIRDGFNWYVYANNNPVIFVDPLGLIPTAKEAAYISGHIYNFDKDSTNEERIVKDDDGASIGWVLADSYVGREGMKVGIYIREGEDVNNPSEYVIAFKGTTITNLSNWKNNAEQLLSSKSADMWDAINFGVNFVDSYSNYEITFVGHSKGGAEAASTAVATNRNAMIFNPATSNLHDYGLDASKYTASMTAYIVKGDIVNYLEGWFSAPIDKVEYLPQQYGGNWYELWQTNTYQRIQNHLMEAVISALTEEGY